MIFLKANNEINKKAILMIILVIIWKALIMWALTLPELPSDIPGPVFFDKIVHFSLFGILAFFIFIAFSLMDHKKFESVMTAFFWSMMYAGFCEHLQGFLPYRHASVYDFLAGLLGAAVIVIVAQLKGGIWESKIYRNPRVLLHICCAACGAYVLELLQNDYELVLYYYNPNICGAEEYKKRLAEVQTIAKKYNLELIIGPYDHDRWSKDVRGLESEPEKGARCEVCFWDRLKKTAREAKNRNFDFFTTTLTISPHKDFLLIKNIGLQLENKYGVKFLAEDFKKNGGFQKSIELSKKLNLYRQDYCGCEFSIRKK